MHSEYRHFHATRWFYVFLIAHLIGWTVIPALVRYNLPLDSIEGTIWGHQLEWGYDKNPYLNGWLTALATYLDGNSGWMVYLFSQLSVAACFWSVWQLAKRMFNPAYALIAALILEGVQYFNFHAIDFNDNTLELGLWALTIFFFYQALQTQRPLRHWLLTGLFAGLGMMAKYYTAALLSGMALFLFLNKENRKQLCTLSPYLGLLVFLMLTLPHIVWLFSHEFVTVTYVFDRASSTPSWTNPFFFPAQFAWQQFETFLPALVLFSFLFIGKKPLLEKNTAPLNAFDRQFLFYVVLGPFLLTLLLSLLTGTNLRAGWGMPLLSFWGLVLLAFIKPRLSMQKLYCFLAFIFTLLGLLLAGYSISLTRSKTPSSANFPGKEIAKTITQQWHDQFHTPLHFVAGSRWLGGNIGFYSTDHPAVFIEWIPLHAPWINDRQLRKEGAVFIWDISEGESLPENIKNQYKNLGKETVLEFSWQRNHQLAPIKIGIAYLAPEK